ncbi:MAG: teichuronic acid biosynthesis glycosyltransferase TuaC [Alteromonadaceae bacterium]|jgi:teichuronic acid biosynthesis glycosyltransferase TuaC
MKVLIVTNMYPGHNPDSTQQGIFVQEQMNSLTKDHNVQCELFVIEGFKSSLNYLTTALKLNFYLMFNKFDAIHVHYGLSGLFMLVNPLKRKWKNVVLTCHGADIQIQHNKETLANRLCQKVVRKSAQIITLNESMDGVVAQYNPQITRLPCGIETDFFNPNDNKPEHVIVFPGRASYDRKNYPLFEKIINEYRKIVPEVKIAIMDKMNRDEIKHTLETASALLMTSLSEGSPQAVKEALSCDLPVVCTNVGDVAGIFEGVSGTAIVELEDDPAQIAQKLYQCIEQSKTTPGERRARILEMGFAQKDVTAELVKLFKQVS